MKLSEAVFTVIDIESTGLDPAADRVVEIGMVTLYPNGKRDQWETLVNPGIPIQAKASAIHHLTDSDTKDAPTFEKLDVEIQVRTMDHGFSNVMVVHEAKFDRSFLPMLKDRKWICTKRLAMHLWPEAPAYGNQVLRYWRKLEVKTNRPPHRAISDAMVTAELFIHSMGVYLERGNQNDVDALIEYANKPILIQKMTFGKHFDKPISSLPPDYIEWVLKNVKDLDPDLKYSLEQGKAPF